MKKIKNNMINFQKESDKLFDLVTQSINLMKINSQFVFLLVIFSMLIVYFIPVYQDLVVQFINFFLFILVLFNFRKNKLKLKTIDFDFKIIGLYFSTIILLFIFLLGLTLLLIIPGIIFYIYWFFVIPILILKNRYNLDALKYSKKLVEGNWLRIFSYIISFYFVIFLFMFFIVYSLYLILPNSLIYLVNYLTNLIIFIATIFISYFSAILFINLEKENKLL